MGNRDDFVIEDTIEFADELAKKADDNPHSYLSDLRHEVASLLANDLVYGHREALLKEALIPFYYNFNNNQDLIAYDGRTVAEMKARMYEVDYFKDPANQKEALRDHSVFDALINLQESFKQDPQLKQGIVVSPALQDGNESKHMIYLYTKSGDKVEAFALEFVGSYQDLQELVANFKKDFNAKSSFDDGNFGGKCLNLASNKEIKLSELVDKIVTLDLSTGLNQDYMARLVKNLEHVSLERFERDIQKVSRWIENRLKGLSGDALLSELRFLAYNGFELIENLLDSKTANSKIKENKIIEPLKVNQLADSYKSNFEPELRLQNINVLNYGLRVVNKQTNLSALKENNVENRGNQSTNNSVTNPGFTALDEAKRAYSELIWKIAAQQIAKMQQELLKLKKQSENPDKQTPKSIPASEKEAAINFGQLNSFKQTPKSFSTLNREFPKPSNSESGSDLIYSADTRPSTYTEDKLNFIPDRQYSLFKMPERNYNSSADNSPSKDSISIAFSDVSEKLKNNSLKESSIEVLLDQASSYRLLEQGEKHKNTSSLATDLSDKGSGDDKTVQDDYKSPGKKSDAQSSLPSKSTLNFVNCTQNQLATNFSKLVNFKVDLKSEAREVSLRNALLLASEDLKVLPVTSNTLLRPRSIPVLFEAPRLDTLQSEHAKKSVTIQNENKLAQLQQGQTRVSLKNFSDRAEQSVLSFIDPVSIKELQVVANDNNINYITSPISSNLEHLQEQKVAIKTRFSRLSEAEKNYNQTFIPKAFTNSAKQLKQEKEAKNHKSIDVSVRSAEQKTELSLKNAINELNKKKIVVDKTPTSVETNGELDSRKEISDKKISSKNLSSNVRSELKDLTNRKTEIEKLESLLEKIKDLDGLKAKNTNSVQQINLLQKEIKEQSFDQAISEKSPLSKKKSKSEIETIARQIRSFKENLLERKNLLKEKDHSSQVLEQDNQNLLKLNDDFEISIEEFLLPVFSSSKIEKTKVLKSLQAESTFEEFQWIFNLTNKSKNKSEDFLLTLCIALAMELGITIEKLESLLQKHKLELSHDNYRLVKSALKVFSIENIENQQ